MPDSCPECGVSVPEGGSCRDHFDALLLLEWRIPGGPGALAHFYAVACYGLQHPDGMNYTAETLLGLRRNVADMLDERATLEELRSRTRRAANGPTRVTRRAGDAEAVWKRGGWPMTVTDVLTAEADAAAYTDRVTQWARSIRETLAAEGM